jgi:hypothetical protein
MGGGEGMSTETTTPVLLAWRTDNAILLAHSEEGARELLFTHFFAEFSKTQPLLAYQKIRASAVHEVHDPSDKEGFAKALERGKAKVLHCMAHYDAICVLGFDEEYDDGYDDDTTNTFVPIQKLGAYLQDNGVTKVDVSPRLYALRHAGYVGDALKGFNAWLHELALPKREGTATVSTDHRLVGVEVSGVVFIAGAHRPDMSPRYPYLGGWKPDAPLHGEELRHTYYPVGAGVVAWGVLTGPQGEDSEWPCQIERGGWDGRLSSLTQGDIHALREHLILTHPGTEVTPVNALALLFDCVQGLRSCVTPTAPPHEPPTRQRQGHRRAADPGIWKEENTYIHVIGASAYMSSHSGPCVRLTLLHHGGAPLTHIDIQEGQADTLVPLRVDWDRPLLGDILAAIRYGLLPGGDDRAWAFTGPDVPGAELHRLGEGWPDCFLDADKEPALAAPSFSPGQAVIRVKKRGKDGEGHHLLVKLDYPVVVRVSTVQPCAMWGNPRWEGLPRA